MWGKTSDEEQKDCGIGCWPGVVESAELPSSSLKMYGGAAFKRVLDEFKSAARSMESPKLDIHEVLFMLKQLYT